MLAAGAVTIAVAAPPLLGSSSLYSASASISGGTLSTRAACVTGPSYAAAVLAQSPTFFWRVAETTPPAVTSLADATGHGLPGTVDGAGLTVGTATTGLIQCDNTYAVRFPGTATSRQFVVQRTAQPNTNVFTISAWVRTGSSRGGWVLGMGSARWGSSTNRDRVLYLQRNGRPGFAVGTGPRTVLQGPAPVNDNQPHLLVGTLSPAGMSLYVDGARVATDTTVTSGAYYTGNEPADQPPPAVPATPDGFGYWRLGYDSTVGLGPSTPSRDQLNGRIDEVAVWQTRALTPVEVLALYDANHW